MRLKMPVFLGEKGLSTTMNTYDTGMTTLATSVVLQSPTDQISNRVYSTIPSYYERFKVVLPKNLLPKKSVIHFHVVFLPPTVPSAAMYVMVFLPTPFYATPISVAKIRMMSLKTV
jgi:hypothetical protein